MRFLLKVGVIFERSYVESIQYVGYIYHARSPTSRSQHGESPGLVSRCTAESAKPNRFRVKLPTVLDGWFTIGPLQPKFLLCQSLPPALQDPDL